LEFWAFKETAGIVAKALDSNGEEVRVKNVHIAIGIFQKY
jgi:hypothetical protein